MILVEKCKRIIYPHYQKHFARLAITEGQLANSHQSIRILFLGDNAIQDYLNDVIYNQPPKITVNKRISHKHMTDAINQYQPDMAIVCLPEYKQYLVKHYHHYQTLHFIDQSVNVNDSWSAIKSRFNRTRRNFSNKIKSKFGFEYRVSNTESDFDYFYYNMYVPYMNKRFTKSYLTVDSYEDLKGIFRRGFLLFVTQDNKDIVGALNIVENDKLIYRRIGILDGDQEYNYMKAQMAMDFYQILFAFEQGFSQLNLMGSYAFLNNGIYQSKRQWGAYAFESDDVINKPFYLILNQRKCFYFFQENSAIVKTDNGLFGLLGWRCNSNISEREKNSLKKNYFSEGLSGMILLDKQQGKTQKVFFEETSQSA